DAFEPEAGSLAQKSRTETDLVIAVAQHALRVRRKDLGQDGLAIFERRAGEIPALSIEQVEREEVQRIGTAAGNRVLQTGKAGGAIGLQMDDLSVDQRRGERQLAESSHQRREFCRPIEAAAGNQADLAVFDSDEQAVAVILD